RHRRILPMQSRKHAAAVKNRHASGSNRAHTGASKRRIVDREGGGLQPHPRVGGGDIVSEPAAPSSQRQRWPKGWADGREPKTSASSAQRRASGPRDSSSRTRTFWFRSTRSKRPRASSSGSARTSGRKRSYTLGGTIRFTWPSSSSRSMNTTPFAV